MNALLATFENARFRVDQLRVGAHVLRFVAKPTETDRLFHILSVVDKYRGRFPEVIEAVFAKVRTDPAFCAQEAARFMPPKPNLAELATLPDGTLGRAYFDHIMGHHLDEQFYPDVEITDDVAYLTHRMMFAHDFWHVLTGFGPSVIDEIGLQSFTHAQTGSPFAATIVGAGIMHLASARLSDLEPALAAIARGRRLGVEARLLLAYPIHENLERPLADVRRELGLV